jgi:hypothetical protein
MPEFLGVKIRRVDGRALGGGIAVLRVSVENLNKLTRCRNATKLCRSSTCIFMEMPGKNQLKIRFLGRCFDVMLSRLFGASDVRN